MHLFCIGTSSDTSGANWIDWQAGTYSTGGTPWKNCPSGSIR